MKGAAALAAHAMAAQAGRTGKPWSIRLQLMPASRQQAAHAPAHLLTEMQVGTAMPFSMSLPLNSLPTPLQRFVPGQGQMLCRHGAATPKRTRLRVWRWCPPPLGRMNHVVVRTASSNPVQSTTLSRRGASLVHQRVALVAQVHNLGARLAGLHNSRQRGCSTAAGRGTRVNSVRWMDSLKRCWRRRRRSNTQQEHGISAGGSCQRTQMPPDVARRVCMRRLGSSGAPLVILAAALYLVTTSGCRQ